MAICACLCGEEFQPKRCNQIYLNSRHRQKDRDRRWPRKRQAALPASLTNTHGEPVDAQASDCPQLLGANMAKTNQARVKRRTGKQPSSEFLTRRQVADILGVSVWALIWWQRRGEGPPLMKLGRSTVRYPVGKFKRWLASKLVSPSPSRGMQRSIENE